MHGQLTQRHPADALARLLAERRGELLQRAESPEPEPGPALDRAALLAAFEGNEPLLCHMIELFLGYLPGTLAELRVAMAQGDARTVTRMAHRLQGSAANFRAGRVVGAAVQLEGLGRTGQLARAGGPLARLEAALDALRGDLLELAAELGGAAGEPASSPKGGGLLSRN